MSIEVKTWDEPEELSESLLKKRDSPKTKFRVSGLKYEPGVKFMGSHREGILFVIGGVCKLQLSTGSAILKKRLWSPSAGQPKIWFFCLLLRHYFSEGIKMKIELTNNEALVLVDFLMRFRDNEILSIEGPAEEQILWDLCTMLESDVPELFDPEYKRALSKARKVILSCSEI